MGDGDRRRGDVVHCLEWNEAGTVEPMFDCAGALALMRSLRDLLGVFRLEAFGVALFDVADGFLRRNSAHDVHASGYASGYASK